MMAMPRLYFALGLVLWAGGVSAAAGEYSDPTGFSFTYPEGWVVLNQNTVANALPAEVKSRIDNGQINLSQVAVAIIRVGPEEFLENVNVVVQPNGEMPVSNAALKELVAAVKQQAPGVGMQMRNFHGSVSKLGSQDALVLDYDAEMAGLREVLKQRQAYVPGGGKTFIITCSGTTDSFQKHLPTFESMLASFKAPAPVATGFKWNQVLVSSIAGGVAGAVIGLIVWVKNKRAAKPPAD